MQIVDVAQYFGESGHSGEPEAAFQIMDQFVESFLKVMTESAYPAQHAWVVLHPIITCVGHLMCHVAGP